jgi:dTDP-4-dehydro-6-deoxy-alpha-D-glucopyranose 2,3-dehydratase
MKKKLKKMDDVPKGLLGSLVRRETEDTIGVESTLTWLQQLNDHAACTVKEVALKELDQWYIDDGLNIRHRSGKFFSIEGIRVTTNLGPKKRWEQPVINQPEVGILGILCQKRNGVLKFLLQAKIEPGNVNVVQLSPTLQATRSNFTRVHGGKTPVLLEYFTDLADKKILVDQLQSEQGARFLKKRNRNMVVEILDDKEIEFPENFKWFTLGQLKELVVKDNILNMDTRTVLSCLMFPDRVDLSSFVERDEYQGGLIYSLCQNQLGVHSLEEIISWFTNIKANAELIVESCDIKACSEWQVDRMSIHHAEDKYFKVIGVEVEIGTREVTTWCQPLVQPSESGIVGFILKKIGGSYHILVQGKMEAGNLDIIEMAPTVQCITGSYTEQEYYVPYLNLFLMPGEDETVRYDAHQSEEGGRFYKEQNRYMVIEVSDDFSDEVGTGHIWMTLGQAKTFMKFNNYFNVEARSLLACFSPV